MKDYWKLVKIGDIGEVVGGGTPSTKCSDYYGGDIPWITPKDLSNFGNRYISRGERMISKLGLEHSSAKMLPPFSVLFTSRAPIGYIAIAKNELCTNQGFKSIIPNPKKCDALFLYYLLKSKKNDIELIANGSTFQEVSGTALKNFEVSIPPLDKQKKIAGILSALDDKIELNNKINRNLEAQAQAIFKSWFVDTQNLDRKLVRVRDFFDISIGKTPPRKEPNWFSDNDADVPWVSISDMGDCGTFISYTSEYLTKEAISMFNIRLVPDNTVLLSFKLTIGRIAITDGEMATNEAIAHFISNDKYINEYLYCYLKNFNFQTIGNTSSIAIAVNSKIIKDMPFALPTKEEVIKFHSITNPMFNTIKSNQRESNRLANIRNALLPKLTSGEFNFSNIEA